MKKKIFNVKQLNLLRTMVKNAFNEKGQGVADLLRALLDEMESAEEEFDETAIEAKVKELLEAQKGEVPEAVAEAIAKSAANVLEKVQNATALSKKGANLPKKVRNAIAIAILRSNKNNVQDNVEAVLKKNAITGLEFADVIDFTIADNWGDSNPIFRQLKRVPYTKFFYTEDDLSNAKILAHQWDKTGEGEKLVQDVEATPKAITTDLIYKRQQIAVADMDDIEATGEAANFLAYINEELDRQIVNTIVMAILVGDSINANGSRVTTFETIGTKTTDDAFTKVLTSTTTTFTLSDARAGADAVLNPYGKKKIQIMSQNTLTTLAAFTYASGGSTFYHSKEEVAGMVGVDEIIVSGTIGDDQIITLLPDGYWVKEKNAINVSYATWEKNVYNHQKERNIGGAIHDMFSTSVVNLYTGN